jgi:hypothetical protein
MDVAPFGFSGACGVVGVGVLSGWRVMDLDESEGVDSRGIYFRNP